MHSPFRRAAPVLVCAAALVTASTQAQSTTPRHPPPQSITITGNYDNALGSSDAASQGVIQRGLLKSRPALRPGEVLEFVPGLIVTQRSGDGKANQYFLRGFNLDHGTDFATTELVQSFLAQHTHVQIHYAPTYSSWLNQVGSPASSAT